MLVDAAAAKIGKYASRESGDTLEMIERPHGGLSFVLVDGQRSGRSAKAISNLVARKVVALLAEGARDGVAARAAHDYLYTSRKGKVRADLQIISIDFESDTLVITRNTETPALLIQEASFTWLEEGSTPIGLYRKTRPNITELPLRPHIAVICFTDGVLEAGGKQFDTETIASELRGLFTAHDGWPGAERVANHLLDRALALDGGFPKDDLSVMTMALLPRNGAPDIRRLRVQFPVPPPGARK